jgi:hypothetical protein
VHVGFSDMVSEIPTPTGRSADAHRRNPYFLIFS